MGRFMWFVGVVGAEAWDALRQDIRSLVSIRPPLHRRRRDPELEREIDRAVQTGSTDGISRWRLMSLENGYTEVGKYTVGRDDE